MLLKKLLLIFALILSGIVIFMLVKRPTESTITVQIPSTPKTVTEKTTDMRLDMEITNLDAEVNSQQDSFKDSDLDDLEM